MQVLVAYGSKRGGTAGLAEMIGKELEAAGVRADVEPARSVRSLESADAVILAGRCMHFDGTGMQDASPNDLLPNCGIGLFGS